MKHPESEGNPVGAVVLGIASAVVVFVAQVVLLANDVVIAADFMRKPIVTIATAWTIVGCAALLVVAATRIPSLPRFARVAMLTAGIALAVPNGPCAVAMTVSAAAPARR